ncbi:MAG: VOC family protein [Hyphomicrobiales bacterium]|nr:MAG: VOC family protein [Hyphomicrobiales bacterium]
MLNHVGFGISNFAHSKRFYVAALAPLGFSILAEGADWAMIGKGGAGRLWFGIHTTIAKPVHVAFTAESRAEVDAFHAAALGGGGHDNGGPGIRALYHAHYYAAFVLDPDGHNIEAVCKPQDA